MMIARGGRMTGSRVGLAAALVTAALTLLSAQERAPHVVMISIDGLRPQLFAESGPLKILTLRRLMQEGAWARVTGVLPTVTYPSHTTLITGVLPAVHGVFDNRIFDPENLSNQAWFWYSSAIKVPTLPGAVRARGLSAASVSWPATVGMALDYNVPEILRSRHRENLDLMAALSWPPRILESYGYSTGQPLAWPTTDADRAGLAAWMMRTFQPNLLLLHIFDSDSDAHTFGPDSPEALAAIERADAEVARVLDAVSQAGLADRTDVVIVSDHGFLPVQKQLQPNFVFKREGLLTTNDRGQVTSWEASFHSSGGSGFVYLKRPDDRALVARVGGLLEQIAADPDNGVEKIWSQAELRQAGAHPDASFGLTMKPGFYTGWAHDALLANTVSKGGHGFDPARPELKASLIMAGPDVPKAGDLGLVPMTRIAPTIARWFDVQLSPEADQPLELAVPASAR
jgi:predicted AlkP superfamily pyrophosphatase or phosphodiesterase